MTAMGTLRLGLLLVGLGPGLARGLEVPVASEAEILAAIAGARPGDEIVIAPGDYLFDTSGISVRRPGTAAQPIVLRAAFPGCTRIVFSTPGSYTEGFKVAAPWWVFEDLIIEGACATDTQCEHAFHVVGEADSFTVRHCVLRNFNAQIKGNSEDPGTGRVFPDDVLIEGNEIYNDAIRQTDNPVTPIDVVGGRRWIVRGNFIHDAGKGQGNGVSYQAFLKGNGRDGLFEQNVVACSWLHAPGVGQARVGLSFGGGGSSPDPICEDGDCSIEHQDGLMRNNIILNCNDVGIYLNEALNCRVHHNTLYANAGIDVRFPPSVADLANNLLTGRIRARDGGSFTSTSNVETVGDAAFESWFADPAARDFTLVGDGSAFVDVGVVLAEVPDDYCGDARGPAPDVGAVEYTTSTCDATATPSTLVVPAGGRPTGPGATLRASKDVATASVALRWARAGDATWSLRRDGAPDVVGGATPFAVTTLPAFADGGVLTDGQTWFYVVRALEPCSGVEAD
jgi:parallel beta-helix repeat protein